MTQHPAPDSERLTGAARPRQRAPLPTHGSGLPRRHAGRRRVAVAAGVALLLCGNGDGSPSRLAGWVAPMVAAQEPAANLQVPSIVTHGEAVVRRAADLAFVTAAVETRAKLPRDAQRQNADLMTSVQQKLAGAGLGKDAVRTLGYSIRQDVDVVNGRRVPREYVARNAVEVRVDAIERTGEIIDAIVQSGATAIGSVRFELREREAAEREALRLAVADARARADAAAAGAGRTVDRVLRIDDSRMPQPYMPRETMMMRAAPDQAMETPVEAGTIEIRAQVSLTVSIK
jgi:uncharacterized protein YggE